MHSLKLKFKRPNVWEGIRQCLPLPLIKSAYRSVSPSSSKLWLKIYCICGNTQPLSQIMFMKVFRTASPAVVKECQRIFGFLPITLQNIDQNRKVFASFCCNW